MFLIFIIIIIILETDKFQLCCKIVGKYENKRSY